MPPLIPHRLPQGRQKERSRVDLSSLPFISAHFRPPLLPPNSPIALLFAMKVLDASLFVFLCSSHDDAHALSCSQWRDTALITFRKEQRHHERNIYIFFIHND